MVMIGGAATVESDRHDAAAAGAARADTRLRLRRGRGRGGRGAGLIGLAASLRVNDQMQ